MQITCKIYLNFLTLLGQSSLFVTRRNYLHFTENYSG